MLRRRLFLGILVLITLLAFYSGFNSSSVNWDIKEQQESVIRIELKREELVNREALEFDSSQIAALSLNNPMGDVEIIGEDRDNICIDYKIVISYSDLEAAEKYLDQMDFRSEIVNRQLLIENKHPSITPSGVMAARVHYLIKVPKEIDLVLNTSFGRMIVQDINGDLTVTLRYGKEDSKFANLTGKNLLNLQYSTAEINNVDGKLNVNFAYSSLTVSNVTDRIVMNGTYSDLSLANINSAVELQAKYGNIALTNLTDSLKGELAYTGFTGSNLLGPIDLQATYSPINLTNIANSTQIKGSNSPINIKLDPELGYQVNLDLKRAKLNSNLELVASELNNVHNRYFGSYGDGQFPLEIESDNGHLLLYF